MINQHVLEVERIVLNGRRGVITHAIKLSSIDTVDKDITSCLIEASRKICGSTNEKVKLRFVNGGIVQAIRQERNKTLASVRAAKIAGLDPSNEDIEKLKSLRNNLKYRVKELRLRSRNEHFNSLVEAEPVELLKATKQALQGKKRKGLTLDPTKIGEFTAHFSSSNDPKDDFGLSLYKCPDSPQVINVDKTERTTDGIANHFSALAIEAHIMLHQR